MAVLFQCSSTCSAFCSSVAFSFSSSLVWRLSKPADFHAIKADSAQSVLVWVCILQEHMTYVEYEGRISAQIKPIELDRNLIWYICWQSISTAPYLGCWKLCPLAFSELCIRLTGHQTSLCALEYTTVIWLASTTEAFLCYNGFPSRADRPREHGDWKLLAHDGNNGTLWWSASKQKPFDHLAYSVYLTQEAVCCKEL